MLFLFFSFQAVNVCQSTSIRHRTTKISFIMADLWKAQPSQWAQRTANPIRQIVNRLDSLQKNPDKAIIPLSLGKAKKREKKIMIENNYREKPKLLQRNKQSIFSLSFWSFSLLALTQFGFTGDPTVFGNFPTTEVFTRALKNSIEWVLILFHSKSIKTASIFFQFW